MASISCCLLGTAVGVTPKFKVYSATLSSKNWRRHCPRPCFTCKSAEDVPPEIRDDPKFVPLTKEDPGYGPTAVLLVGFQRQEVPKVQAYLKSMGAEFVKVIACEASMLNDSLWNCMHRTQLDVNAVEMAKGLPRICFMSGMTGEEILTIVETFPDIGLDDENAFSALVPNNAQKFLQEVIEEVMGDHERLSRGAEA